MDGIIDQKSKKWIKENITKINKRHLFIDNYKVRICDLERIFKDNRFARKLSKKESHVHMGDHLSSTNLLATSILCIACSLHKDSDNKGLFPKSWITIKEIPNPNDILSSLFSQLFQLAISATSLTETGLDNSSRIILRSTVELSWQMLILIYFREDFKKYVNAGSFEEVNKSWWELFGRGRMLKKLDLIEKELNIDETSRVSLGANRKEVYAFFSESVHHGYPTILMSSFKWHFQKDSRELDFESATGNWSALGGASVRSLDTLFNLNRALLYFLDMFFFIIDDFHGIDLEQHTDSYWKIALVSKDCARGLLKNNE